MATGSRTDKKSGKRTENSKGTVQANTTDHNSLNTAEKTSGTNQLAVADRNVPSYKQITEINGPWKVRFDPEWFYPVASLTGDEAQGIFIFDQLIDWSEHDVDAIKYFSGTATYGITFEVNRAMKGDASYYIDLGEVFVSASVRLNGKDLGVVWCAPWRVDVSEVLVEGENQLEIEVVNCWPNRLIGDGKLPEVQRRTNTNIDLYYRTKRNGEEHQLLPSGLLGPVTLLFKGER